MRFEYFYIKNYIPIYNGLGLYDLELKNINRFNKKIIFIVGDNGKGKSMLQNSLSPLLEDKNLFIEGREGQKKLILINNDDIYNINIIYTILTNGTRGKTKCYINKNGVELNPNGNVTSYKEILYIEFNLDNNFESLSKLSCEDKGIVNKKPSERKSYVSFIINEVADYNKLQKTFAKRSSNYNSIINQLTNKMNQIGNIELLKSELIELQNKKNIVLNNIDNITMNIGELNHKIKTLNDTDIKEKYDNILIKIMKLKQDNESKFKLTKNFKIKNLELLEVKLKKMESLILNINDDIEYLNNNLIRHTSKLNSNEDLLDEINNKKIINDFGNISNLKNKIKELKIWIDRTENTFNDIGFKFNVNNIDTNNLIELYNTSLLIEDKIDVFKSGFNISLINKLFKNPNLSINIDNLINDYNKQKNGLIYTRNELELKLELLDEKPKGCNISDCPYLKRLSNVNLNKEQIILELNKYNELEKMYLILEKKIKHKETFDEAKMKLYNIFRDLYIISSKGIFKDKSLIINNINEAINYIVNDISYSEKIQKMIDISSLIDEYNIKYNIYNELNDKLNKLGYNEELYNKLIEDINYDKKMITNLSNDINIKKKELDKLNIELNNLIAGISDLNIINDNNNKIDEYNYEISKIKDDVNNIEQYNNKKNELIYSINNLKSRLGTIENSIYNVTHKISSKMEYEKQYNEFINKYSKLETFKKYSNVNKDGIQIAFVELYMHKVISMCNELLKYVLDGEYVLQKCILDEGKFKIPCLGNGFLIDDISYMSAGQRAIIGSTMSFALIHHSSMKYNILRLDEIDAELDTHNRRNLIEVINKEIEILNVEQLFMISHNTEYNKDDYGIIELPHKGERYINNIIWSYYDNI